jgi:hypothetical protein
MPTIDKAQLDSLIHSEWDYLESRKGEWSLLEGEQDMEVLEHVLRCILHMGLTQDKPQEFKECICGYWQCLRSHAANTLKFL